MKVVKKKDRAKPVSFDSLNVGTTFVLSTDYKEVWMKVPYVKHANVISITDAAFGTLFPYTKVFPIEFELHEV